MGLRRTYSGCGDYSVAGDFWGLFIRIYEYVIFATNYGMWFVVGRGCGRGGGRDNVVDYPQLGLGRENLHMGYSYDASSKQAISSSSSIPLYTLNKSKEPESKYATRPP